MSKLFGQKITKRSAARYMLTPGITPEFRRLGYSLRQFAYIIALIFARAGIFQNNHPYVNPANIGRFGIGDVFGAAAQTIRLDRRHFPQVAIFTATTIMVVLMTLQLVLTVFTLGVNTANAAGPTPVFSCTGTCDPANDLALDFLGNIFGEYDFITEGNAGTRSPGPVHYGLWQLLAYYSNALLIIATFIVLYYVVSAVGETAVYGTPFGRRFNTVWAPLRLVTAIGLLVPLPMDGVGGPGVGLNSGQYIVLFAARSGSNLATNSFTIFRNAVSTASYAQSFVTQPGVPPIESLVQAAFAWHLCTAAVESAAMSETLDLIDTNWSDTAPDYLNFYVKDPGVDGGWSMVGGAGSMGSPPTFPAGSTILTHYVNEFGTGGASANVRIGEVKVALGPPAKPEYCGVISLPQNFMADENNNRALTDSPTAGTTANKFNYARQIREAYLDQIGAMYNVPAAGTFGGAPSMRRVAIDMACMSMSQGCLPTDFGDPALLNSTDVATRWINQVNANLTGPSGVLRDAAALNAYAVQNAVNMNTGFVAQRGWAVAALYFNEIMRANLVLQHAASGTPMMTDPPVPVEHFQNENPSMAESQASPGGVQSSNGFDTNLIYGSSELGKGDGNPLSFLKGFFSSASVSENSTNKESPFDAEIGGAMGTGLLWFNNAPSVENMMQAEEGGGCGLQLSSILTNCIRKLIGIQGFYDLAHPVLGNPMTHNPLAIMQNIGDQLTTRAMWVLPAAAIVGALSPALGNALFVLGGMGFGVGMFLGYVLPLLPFLYFFFGVVQWGFSVFEAVVAAPLWALSHLRIDGEGLPGPAAMNGYYLIFEIFLRPILLLFGLLASSLCFTAGAYMLHQTWRVAWQNLRGDLFNGPIDGFIMVILYALISYMLANSCFKLITMIPMGILRWMGQGGATPLSDMFGDIAGGLQQNTMLMAGGLAKGTEAAGTVGVGTYKGGKAAAGWARSKFGKKTS